MLVGGRPLTRTYNHVISYARRLNSVFSSLYEYPNVAKVARVGRGHDDPYAVGLAHEACQPTQSIELGGLADFVGEATSVQGALTPRDPRYLTYARAHI